MSQIVKIGDATLYHGDCMTLLPEIGSICHVITDPPYSSHTHKMAKTSRGNGREKRLVTFMDLDDGGFETVVESLLAAADGWVVATCDYRHAALMYDHPRFVRLGAWVKTNPMPQITRDRPGQGFETILVMHSGKVPKAWNRGGGAGVWTHSVHCGALVPTQKPIGLVCELVSDFTCNGDVVLDPFMGSGTTGVACAALGRKFVGIELDRRYFDIACERIEKAYAQGRLFAQDAKPEAMDQPELL